MISNKIAIITGRNCGKRHVAEATLVAFEDEFIDSSHLIIYRSKYTWFTNKILKKLKMNFVLKDYTLIKQIKATNPSLVFFSAMNWNSLLEVKAELSSINYPVALYLVDTWESSYSNWLDILREIKPKYIFCAYLKSVSYFENYFENVFFLPYSMDNKTFHNYEEEKSMLFMQMGRKNQSLHHCVLSYLKGKNLDESTNYCYEKEAGKIIFPDTADLARNINKTKFFILAPQNKENNNRTGNISDVTARFYEGMACKSLLVGFKPLDTFDILFPYPNAMIEISDDGTDFDEKIEWLLAHEEEYYAMVEKNYNYVMTNHTWAQRLKQFTQMLDTNMQYDY